MSESQISENRNNRDTLYYDGRCPLCAREVRWLRRRQRGGLELVDIHGLEINETEQRSLLEVLHLRAASGEWLTGIDATSRAWSHVLPGWLLKPLSWRWLRLLVNPLYFVWARRRYQRLYGCGVCRGE